VKNRLLKRIALNTNLEKVMELLKGRQGGFVIESFYDYIDDRMEELHRDPNLWSEADDHGYEFDLDYAIDHIGNEFFDHSDSDSLWLLITENFEDLSEKECEDLLVKATEDDDIKDYIISEGYREWQNDNKNFKTYVNKLDDIYDL